MGPMDEMKEGAQCVTQRNHVKFIRVENNQPIFVNMASVVLIERCDNDQFSRLYFIISNVANVSVDVRMSIEEIGKRYLDVR